MDLKYSDGHEGAIACPKCGGFYLHHGGVHVYSRSEDDDTVTLTSVEGESLTHGSLPNKGSGNPSARRYGLAVDFDCEICGPLDLRLILAQHKGATLVEWRKKT